jgi:hypothetical protein
MKSFLKQIEESFQSLEEKEKRWQDNDGDGKWYEPGVDVKAESKGKYDDGDGKDEKCDHVPCNEDISICEICGESLINEEEIDEASTSAGAGAYMTPKAFGKADDDTVEALGYKRVQEAMDNKYERLIEGYKTFALSDPKMSPAKKVNASIKNVAKQLKEIEETIKYTSRLKTESGISHSGFGPSTSKALGKISERLIKISERVRSLGE